MKLKLPRIKAILERIILATVILLLVVGTALNLSYWDDKNPDWAFWTGQLMIHFSFVNIGFICLVGAVKPVNNSTSIITRLQKRIVTGVEQKILLIILGILLITFHAGGINRRIKDIRMNCPAPSCYDSRIPESMDS